MGIWAEEEVLGQWWSILSAYQRGDWYDMIRHCHALVDLGEALGRPYLIAIGHALMAKAIRNKGGRQAVDEAERELSEALRGEDYQSPLTLRLKGKVHSRREELEKALSCYKEAESLMKRSSRSDAWFLLEKTKLLRNIATMHGRLAEQAQENGDISLKPNHLAQAERYITLCSDAVAVLENHLKAEADIERMMLAFCIARHLEDKGDLKGAMKEAEQALKLSVDLQQESYAARVRMFLFHAYMEDGNMEKAVNYFGSLLPLAKYSSGRFEWHYGKYVKPREKDMVKCLEEQCKPTIQ
jgi:tetratricopeptide (TPR) repeat protein